MLRDREKEQNQEIQDPRSRTNDNRKEKRETLASTDTITKGDSEVVYKEGGM